MKAVLVTTEFRGVFFGYLATEPGREQLTLVNARNCLQWSADCKGFLGLAANGPTDSCRVRPRVDKLTLYGITSISSVTAEAAEKWKAGPWKE